MTPPCDVHKVKLCPPTLSMRHKDRADVIRKGTCQVCGMNIEVVYGFAGAFDTGDFHGEIAYEEVE